MPFKRVTTISIILMLSLLVSACGTIATPAPLAENTPLPVTLAPRATTEDAAADEADAEPTAVPTEAPTEVPPTEVPTEEPTATATSTPTPLPPTEVPPTEAPPEEAQPAGDIARGDTLFHNGKDAAPACVTCHLVEEDRVQIGPSMIGIVERAATRVEGQSAAEYVHTSILEPNAFIVPNTESNVFAAGDNSLMFQDYADYLTDQDVADLVAYVLSLE